MPTPGVYFQKKLNLSPEEAMTLHKSYYREYGLAIQGLLLHHDIDVSDFNTQVDDALPLDDILKPNPELRKMLKDIDPTKCRLWLFTNAYKNHGHRVVKLLGIDDLFEGLTYCDYFQTNMVCKPQAAAFEKVMRQARITDVDKCYFVDDSALNVAAATKLGWHAVNVKEEGEILPVETTGYPQIRNILDVRTTFPHLFKQNTD